MPFLFLRDGNPLRHTKRPYMVYTIILVNMVMLAVTEIQPSLGFSLGYTPRGSFLLDDPTTLLTYQFVHGDLLHLFGNMLLLYVFGDNVEDSMGHGRFLLFYLLVGIGSGLMFGVVEVMTTDTPAIVVGASGSIGGILAAYLMLHPRARVLVLIAFKFPIFAPSWIFIALYIAFDIVMAFSGDTGVAWWAHIGGFLSGLALVRAFKYKDVPLFAAAEHYPHTPFPELEGKGPDDQKPWWRRFSYDGAPKPRPPLSRAAAIRVFLLKVISYIILLFFIGAVSSSYLPSGTGLTIPVEFNFF